MSVGDQVWTVRVWDFDGKPYADVDERAVVAVLDDGNVVTRSRYDSVIVYSQAEIFATKRLAEERAVDLLRERIATVIAAYAIAIDKLLTPASSAV
jgi:hypothetical protein